MNLRSVIKSVIVDLLTTQDSFGAYPTLAENRVYPNRFRPLLDEDGVSALPAICLYIVTDVASVFDNETKKIVSNVMIECIADGDNADAVIDAMSNQVEYILDQHLTLDGNVNSFVYTGGSLGTDEDSNSNVVAWKMTYDIDYTTESDSDGSQLPYIDGIDVDYGHGTGDTIDIP